MDPPGSRLSGLERTEHNSPRNQPRTRHAATASSDPFETPIKGAEHREVGGVQLDVVEAGNCRGKRLIYRAGFRGSKHMKPQVGTDLRIHAHVGFLARGEILMVADGCVLSIKRRRSSRSNPVTTG